MTQFLKNKTTQHILASLVIIIIMVYAAQWAWVFLEAQEESPKVSTNTHKMARPIPAKKAVNHDMRDILSANLFNQASRATENLIQQVKIPKTKQRLFLHGIIMSTIPENSVALITGKRTDAPIPYQQGDKLPKQGGEIYQIFDGYVQIKRNGRLEQLEIIETLGGKRLDKNSFKRTRVEYPANLSELKSSYQDNARQLLGKFGLEKNSKGIKLGTKKGKLPSGLQANDIITSVNGYTLEDIENNPDLLDQLLVGGNIEASLERDGRTIHFKLPQKLLDQWKTFK
jgi:type II secretion system protein C